MATRRQNGGARDHVPRSIGRGFGPGDADPWYGPGYEEHEMDSVRVHGPRYREDIHRGRGPKGYQRSDERIYDDVCRLLTDDPDLDPSDIEVEVRDGEVYLTGTVASRRQKRLAEEIADAVTAVVDVHNHLTIRKP